MNSESSASVLNGHDGNQCNGTILTVLRVGIVMSRKHLVFFHAGRVGAQFDLFVE